MWDRPKVNFVLDAVMFLLLMAMAGIGFLMHYVLIPGRERWAKYGRQVDLYLWGWDRHDWGALHFYLALALLAVLVVHLILHWSQIVGLFQRLVAAPRARRLILWFFLLISLLLIYFPFLVSPEVQEVGRGRGRGQHLRSEEQTVGPAYLAATLAVPPELSR